MTNPDEPAHVALPLPARILAGRCSIPTPSAPLGVATVAAAAHSTAAAVALLALLGALLALFIARTARSGPTISAVPEGNTVPPNVPASAHGDGARL